MCTEFEKMRSQQLANTSDEHIQISILNAKKRVLELNKTYCGADGYREMLISLIPEVPDSTCVCPPFQCDHGNGIKLGENVFVNSGCTFLDGGLITVGNYTLIGPNVQIYTPQHPMDSTDRRQTVEYAYPVNIGADCWIGGGAIICPGVTIGDRCVIGAGSVVTKDVPSDSLAVGNPARVIKKLK